MKRILKTFIVMVLTFSISIMSFGNIVQAKDIAVKDVPNTDEAYEQIQWVLNQGYMGLTLGKFLPNSFVRRNEFTVILAKLNGDVKSLAKPSKSSFKDVAVKDQFFRYIETEKKYMTFFKTSSGSYFKPLTYMTREDSTMSIVKALGYDQEDAVSDNVDSEISLEDMIDDAGSVSPALKQYVTLAVQNELIDLRQADDKYYVDPKKNITRKQLALLIYNAYQKKDFSKSDDASEISVPDDSSTSTSGNTGSSGTTKPKDPVVTGINLVLPSNTINVDDIIKATVDITMEPSSANKPNAIFSSKDPSIAMVDGNGNIVGLKSGTTEITAKAGNSEAKAQLTVNPKLDSIGITIDRTSLKVGELVKAYPQINMKPSDAPKPQYSLTSNNPSVAIVDNDGNVKAIGEGSADLVLTCGEKSSKVTVNVTKDQTPAAGNTPSPGVAVSLVGDEVTTIAGNGSSNNTDGDLLTGSMSDPYDVSVDSKGYLYVANESSLGARKISPDGNMISIKDAPSFYGVAVDKKTDRVYFTNGSYLYMANNDFTQVKSISDYANGINSIDIDKDGRIYGINSYSLFIYNNGNWQNIMNNVFNDARDIAVAGSNIYVSDGYKGVIYKVTLLPTRKLDIIAGVEGKKGFMDGDAKTALFNEPRGIAVDANGNIFVADMKNNAIRIITSDGKVKTLVGNPSTASSDPAFSTNSNPKAGYRDGKLEEALFDNPRGLCIDNDGNLIVTDVNNNVVRKIVMKK